VFDIDKYYRPGDVHDFLIKDTHLGAALATYFSSEKSPNKLARNVVLMRGHGMTVVGPTIESTVLRAIYTQKNATIQTTALNTHAATFGTSSIADVKYLNDEECDGSTAMSIRSAPRPWALWVREVESANLYVNRA
jgi:ribulose-5-phosphate 4-epimerase/fuculose-1-phosphate aldolase